jgi:hypothetical protein
MSYRHQTPARALGAPLFAVLLLAGALAACGGGDERARAAGSETPAAATPNPVAGGVAYEPAYPTEVSSEDLSESDVTQQETPHSHDGGEEHTHGDEEDHAEDEGDHGHPH